MPPKKKIQASLKDSFRSTGSELVAVTDGPSPETQMVAVTEDLAVVVVTGGDTDRFGNSRANRGGRPKKTLFIRDQRHIFDTPTKVRRLEVQGPKQIEMLDQLASLKEPIPGNDAKSLQKFWQLAKVHIGDLDRKRVKKDDEARLQGKVRDTQC